MRKTIIKRLATALLLTGVVIFYYATADAGKSDGACILDVQSLRSQMSENGVNIKKESPPRVDENKKTLSHVLEFSSGVEITFSTGGCAHHGFSYSFTHVKDMPPAKDEGFFKFIHAQINLIPFSDQKDADLLSRMVNTLQQAANSGWDGVSDLSAPLGDAMVSLKDVGRDRFVITYDFAL